MQVIERNLYVLITAPLRDVPRLGTRFLSGGGAGLSQAPRAMLSRPSLTVEICDKRPSYLRLFKAKRMKNTISPASTARAIFHQLFG